MKKLQSVWLISILLIAGIALTSCESLKKMVENHPTMAKYESKPNPLEMRGDKIKVEIKGDYQPKYFNTNAIVVVQPSVNYEGGSVSLKPLILRGEKTKGQGTLISKTSGGSFTYNDEIDYVQGMEKSQLVLNPVAYVEKKAKDMNVAQESDALEVKGNVRLGETKVANGTMVTSSRIDKTGAVLCHEENRYEKETVIPHNATIYFLVDMSNLNWNLPLNRKAENKKLVKDLDSILNIGMQIKNVEISAWASPEGEESRNQNLSDNRTKTGEKYFRETYERILKKRARAMKVKTDSLKQDLDIKAQSLGEDWDGFIADLRSSEIPDKNTIISVISSHTDKASREQEIRNMTVIYKEIEDEILPSLRRSEILVNFLMPKKTDEQIAEWSLTQPDSLDLEELLYSATLTEDKEQQLNIYNSAIRIFPEDFRAYLNASSLLIAKGDLDNAQSLLETANGIKPNQACIFNNMGAIALAKGDLKNAKSQFQSGASSKEAQQNMGILDIKEGNYAGAVAKLSANNCHYNLALAQLMNAEVAAAKATLQCMEKQTADGLYLLAVCYARENNKSEAISALNKAIGEKPVLKAQAQKDTEFLQWSEDPDFQNILK